MADRETTETRGRGPDEIRHEIERTRSAMDHTVDELADRLSPGRLLDEVWDRVKSRGPEGIGNAVRDHPIPIALMGLGLGWLAIEQATGRSVGDSGNGHDSGDELGRRRTDAGTGGAAEGRRGPYRSDAVSGDVEFTDVDEESGRSGSKVRNAASSVKDRVAHAGSAAGDASSTAAHAAKSAGRRARRTLSDLIDENPLALGALAFGVGLASGVSAPSTALGDRLMGRASDDLEKRAKQAGRETVDTAKAVARDAARAASDEAEAQLQDRDLDATAAEGVRRAKQAASELASDAEQAAGEVGHAAKEAAKDRAEREGDDRNGDGRAASGVEPTPGATPRSGSKSGSKESAPRTPPPDPPASPPSSSRGASSHD